MLFSPDKHPRQNNKKSPVSLCQEKGHSPIRSVRENGRFGSLAAAAAAAESARFLCVCADGTRRAAPRDASIMRTKRPRTRDPSVYPKL